MKPPILATHGLSSKMKHVRGLCPTGWLTDTARPHQVWQSQTVGTGIWAPFRDSDLLHSSDSTPLTTPANAAAHRVAHGGGSPPAHLPHGGRALSSLREQLLPTRQPPAITSRARPLCPSRAWLQRPSPAQRQHCSFPTLAPHGWPIV